MHCRLINVECAHAAMHKTFKCPAVAHNLLLPKALFCVKFLTALQS